MLEISDSFLFFILYIVLYQCSINLKYSELLNNQSCSCARAMFFFMWVSARASFQTHKQAQKQWYIHTFLFVFVLVHVFGHYVQCLICLCLSTCLCGTVLLSQCCTHATRTQNHESEKQWYILQIIRKTKVYFANYKKNNGIYCKL